MEELAIGERIGILQLTKRQVNHNNSSATDHLLFCNHSAMAILVS